MDRDTVIRLAREAGFDINEKFQQISCDGYDYTEEAEKLAALAYAAGAEAEREACALDCEAQEPVSGDAVEQGIVRAIARQCAHVIRARGNGGEKL